MITSFRGPYRFLSNFYDIKVLFRGNWFNSSEHAYMSAKSDDPSWLKECMSNKTPGEIKKKSRNTKLREDWDDIKLDVMREVIRCKFNYPANNKEVALINRLLVETGDVPILEGNSWGDVFWGVNDKTLKGQNNLGKILMERREELKQFKLNEK